MDGFNNNMLLGLALGGGLPSNERLLTALAAGQMRSSNPIGPIMLKPLIDARVSAEAQRTSAEQATASLRRAVRLELPAGTASTTLRVPDAATVTFAKAGGADSAQVSSGGIVRLDNDGDELTVTVTADGVDRTIVVARTREVAQAPGVRAPADAGMRQDPNSAGTERGVARK